MKKRVLVAMSGGVDSSVAAALLVEQGYEVVGATMQVWDYTQCEIEEGFGTCCSSVDVDDARSVCDKLKIPFYVLNCEAKFKQAVIDPFINDYLNGKTPSPCVNCNTFLKFDHLIQKMHELECDYLATGHYACIEKVKQNGLDEYKLITSEDSAKDQTYFLFTLQSEILKHLLFPIGHLKKPDVRKIAEEKGLVNARKKDSTGICFVGKTGYENFIKDHAAPEKFIAGKIKRYPNGEILGHHDGIHKFTYGQRRGLGMTYHETLFVLKIDAAEGTVWVGEEKYLFSSEVVLKNLSFMSHFTENEKLRVKIRFHHKGEMAQIKLIDGGAKLIFDVPQRAITPGQAAVIYRDNQLIGGGWIQ